MDFRLEHVALWCRDLERMRQFYQTFFGCAASAPYTNAKKGFSSYFLAFPNGGRLELMHSSSHDELHGARHLGFAHLALSVGSPERVDEWTHQLESRGVIIESPPRRTGDGYYESVLLDPEGNRIEIVASQRPITRPSL